MLRLTLLIGLLTACTGPAPAPTPDADTAADAGTAEAEAPEKVQRALDVAKAIQADPDNADAILKDKGMTPDAFEALLFEIAQDAELSKAYAKGLEG